MLPDHHPGLSLFKCCLLCLFIFTGTAYSDEIKIGKYTGKWKDNGNFSGKFIVIIQTADTNTISGTLHFKSPPCRLPMPFEVASNESNQIDVVIDSKSNCGDIHFILDYENQTFNGVFKDAYYKGKIWDVEFKE